MRRTSMAPTAQSQTSWLECVKWLNDCGVLPEQLRSKLKANMLTISDLVYALQDGIILCNLINNLAPGSIETSLIQRRTQSRLACIKNIRLFLDVSKELFDLIDQELFEPQMLYDLDIECVIVALSKISKTKKAEQLLGRKGFDINSSQDDSDIYYNIKPVDEADGMYTTDYDILKTDDGDSIYKSIMKSESDASRKHSTSNFTKKDHVTREIYETENRYVKTLSAIIDDFMKPLSTVLREDDKKTIFTNIEALKNLHSNLLEEITTAIRGGHGRTSRICKVFDSYKEKLMKEYVDYFAGMKIAISKVDLLNTKSIEFKKKLEECRNNSEFGNFKLVDLIKIPYQRVLKYHLLFNEFNKQTDENHNAKKDIAQTYLNMMDIANYLNEAHRDHEMIDLIDELNSRLQDFTQSSFNSANLRDYGHLIKDDNVRIKEHGDLFGKTRYLLLFEKALFICKSKGENYSYKSTLLFTEYELEDSRGLDSNNNSSNNLQINLFNSNDRGKVISLFLKDEKQKNEWKQAFLGAIDKLLPKGYNQNNHSFILSNFERQIICCSICNKVLYGVFFQGYKCSKCPCVTHKMCLLKTSMCTGRSSICTPPQRNNAQRPSLAPDNKRLTKFIPYRVRAIYPYSGRPVPPDNGRSDCQVLTFKSGDLIQVTDDDDDAWWKGIKVGGNSIEGYFPKSYVQITKVESYATRSTLGSDGSSLLATSMNHISLNQNDIKSLEMSNWYCACERIQAEVILKRIETTADSIFLIRPRQEGGYAISIKSKLTDKVDHIRINVVEINGSSDSKKTNVYLVEQIQFSSIHELVQFYMKTKLEENFPQVKTTLGIPYRQALPTPISQAIAEHNYFPTNLNADNSELPLKKDEKYCVLSRETSGWWKVYNQDGLIGFAPGSYLKELK